MDELIKEVEKHFVREDLPPLRPGDTVRLYLKVTETRLNPKTRQMEEKTRLQAFEGTVIAIRGSGTGKTITVRKISHHGVGVERIVPLSSPSLEKIEVLRHAKVRRAKLYFLREKIGKAARLKELREKPKPKPQGA